MDYTGLHWAELIPIIISIIATIGILVAITHDYLKGILTEVSMLVAVVLGLFAVSPGIIFLWCGFGAPNTEDDFKCKCFIQHCDKKLLGVRKNWPNLSVIYDGEEVFSKGVRRQSLLYLKSLQENKVDNSKQKIDGIINEVIEKGMNVTVN